MRNRVTYLTFLFLTVFFISSCESEAERIKRKLKEKKQQVEIETKQKKEAEEFAFQKEQMHVCREGVYVRPPARTHI